MTIFDREITIVQTLTIQCSTTTERVTIIKMSTDRISRTRNKNHVEKKFSVFIFKVYINNIFYTYTYEILQNNKGQIRVIKDDLKNSIFLFRRGKR